VWLREMRRMGIYPNARGGGADMFGRSATPI
jgi:hypothetical protein